MIPLDPTLFARRHLSENASFHEQTLVVLAIAAYRAEVLTAIEALPLRSARELGPDARPEVVDRAAVLALLRGDR